MKSILHILVVIITITFLCTHSHITYIVNAAANNTPQTPVIPGTPTITPNAAPLTPPTTAAPVTKLTAPKKSPIFQSSKFLTYNDKTKTYHIWGNVNIKQKDTVLTADDATFNETTQEGLITGNPKLAQPGVTVTGDKIRVFYKEQKAIIDGNVHAIYDTKQIPPKNGKAHVKKKDDEPTHMYAPHAVFYWKKNQGEITGGVRVVQNDKSITADKAVFDNNTNQIVFTENVVVHRGKDDTMTSQKLTLNTVINEAIAEGNVEAMVMVDEAEDKNRPSKSKNSKEKQKSRRQMREEEEKQRKEQEKVKSGAPLKKEEAPAKTETVPVEKKEPSS